MIIVYILALNKNKFFVDRIKININENLNDELIKNIELHRAGFITEWTKMYKPIGIYQIYKNCILEDENKYTKIMMAKYGIENVRGGIYKKIDLTEKEKLILLNEVKQNEERMFNPLKEEIFCCNICDKEFEEEEQLMEHEYVCKRTINMCYNCNTRGHYVSECYTRCKQMT